MRRATWRPRPELRTWTVQAPDTTPPQTTINANPAALSRFATASFGFTSNEQGSTFECSLDSAAFAACTSPRDLHGPGRRPAHSSACGPPTPRATWTRRRRRFTWTVDTAAPQTTIGAGPPGNGTGHAAPRSTSPPARRARRSSARSTARRSPPARPPRAYSSLAARRARVPRARDRSGRERRPDAGDAQLDDHAVRLHRLHGHARRRGRQLGAAELGRPELRHRLGPQGRDQVGRRRPRATSASTCRRSRPAAR